MQPGKTVNGGRSSVGRAPDCDSGGRGFETHRPPHLQNGPLAQLVEQWTLNPLVEGSNPSWPTKNRFEARTSEFGFFVSTGEIRTFDFKQAWFDSRVILHGPPKIDGAYRSHR